MGSLKLVIIGVVAGSFLLLLLVIFSLIVIRRRFKRVQKGPGLKYRRLDSAVVYNAPDMNWTNIPLKKKIVAAQSVSWADPLTQPDIRKPRSVSCPESHRPASPYTSTNSHKETPNKRRRTTKIRRKKAKTDGYLHVCQIQFSVFYNFYHSRLFLKLVCAVNIPSHFGVTYGSYLKAELLPSMEKAATNIQYHSNNPVFDESFEFPGINSDDLSTKTLKIKLFTIDRFSHSNLVGTAFIKFADLEINPENPTTVWKPLSPHEHQLSPVSSKESLDQGLLYLSLRYQLIHNKLTVVVMKATNLPHAKKIFTIDPYVVIELLFHSNVVQTRKTSCKRRTTSPCWNEPLVFAIDAKIPISEYNLHVKVMNSNNLCEDVTLGTLEIGYHAEGLGKQHWKEMLVKKNQDRAMCHKLNSS